MGSSCERASSGAAPAARPGDGSILGFHHERRVRQPYRGPGELRDIILGTRTNVLSIDLETWHGTSCVEETFDLLNLLRERRVTATFFVLGSVALSEPDLVRRLDGEGHEIASHGWDHQQLCRKTSAAFLDEMRRSMDVLVRLVDKPVMGYRAPHFSVDERTYWAYDALAKAGFKYDSSVFPVAGPRYGVPGFPRGPVRVLRGSVEMVEMPLSTVRLLGMNLPVAGGGYFRLLSYPLIAHAVREVNREGNPFVAYCHPYEFRRAPLRWPRAGAGVAGRLKANALEAKFNMFRSGLRSKLARLLEEFRFGPFREVLRDALNS
jgi:polysaccharide deacetylase family protein (PEP-CTERM system associated)